VPNPPYAVEPTTFRFAGLAFLAGRSALGGQREVALATYLAARLAHDTQPDRGISRAARAERAAHAKNWLSTLVLPPNVRTALARLVDASTGEPADAGSALADVMHAVESFLDAKARTELEHLAAALQPTPVAIAEHLADAGSAVAPPALSAPTQPPAAQPAT